MTSADDGGPAFPITVPDKYGRAPSGMSLRDAFAMAALTGVLASLPPSTRFSTDAAKAALAEDSYALADAMLKARKP